MAKKCSVLPQIRHNERLVNSELFNQLWQKAKTDVDNPFEAREKAKRDYYRIFDPSFKAKNGDWELLYKLNNNLMTDKDLITFTSVYKGDINLLKKSITIELNSQGEPATTVGSQFSKAFAYVNDDSDYLSNEDQSIMNRLFSKIIILTFEQEGKLNLLNLTAADFSNDGSVKNTVIRELEAIYYSTKNLEIAKIITYLKNDDKNVWRLFKGYFLSKFNIKVNDVTDYETDELASKEIKVDPTNWDDSQLNRDLIRTANATVKFELMKAYYSEFNMRDATMQNAEVKIDTNKFGILVPIDPDDVWNQILSINYGLHSKEEVILNLTYISDIKFSGGLEVFINRLKSDDDFYNAFYSTAKLAIIDDVTLVVDKDYEKENTAYFDIVTNNRKSKASNVAYDNLLGSIQNKVKVKNHDLANIIDISNSYKNKTNLSHKLNVIKSFAESLGIVIEDHHVGFYLKSKGISGVNYMDLPNYFRIQTVIEAEEKQVLSSNPEFTQIQIVLDELKVSLDAIAYSIFKSYGKDYAKLKKSNVIEKLTVAATRPLYFNSTSRSALSTIASVVKVDYAKMSSMSYYNSKFDRQQSPQYNSFLTDFFDGIVAGRGVNISSETIMTKFRDYLDDPRLDYDNFLWQDPMETSVNTGMFNPSWEGDKKTVQSINDATFKSLNVVQVSGNRYSNASSGDSYKELRDDNWNLTEIIYQIYGYYLIPTSDSGRMFGIHKKFERFEGMLGKDSFDNRGFVYAADAYASMDEDNRLYRYLRNNLYQEFKDIQLTFNKLYDVDYYLKHKILRPNDTYKSKESRKGLLKGIEVGNDLELVKNNKPTGNVFSKTNLVYVEEGISKTIASTFDSNGYDYLTEVLKMDLSKGVEPYAEEIMKMFLGYWLEINQLNTAKALEYVKADILNAYKKRLDTSDANSELTESEILKNSFVSVPKNAGEMSADEVSDWSYNVACLNLFLNNHLNTVIFGNLLFGNVTEFKNMVDWNKRVNQTIRNGTSSQSTETYKQVICEDIELKSNMLELYKNDPTISKKDYKILEERYKNDIVTTDAIDFITDEEFYKRLHAFGLYDRYETLIEDIKSGKPFNVKAYLHLVEQLKYFSYTRKKVGDRVISFQNKNSTVVLFKRFVKGTEKEILYDFMIQNNINDINTGEGHKLGGVVPIKLHNDNGTINRSIMNLKKEDVDKHSATLSYDSLRIQLEVVPHLENKENRIATQLIKKTLNNLIASHNYNMNEFGKSRKVKGRTNNFNDGERGVFEELHYSLSYNAEHAAMELLKDFGAIKNGKINMSEDGSSIIVDMKKVSRIIEDYFLENSTDYNIIKAVGINKKTGLSNLPYHHPSLLRLIESVLEAKITNKVTRQKIFGSHVAIQPDMFNNPIKPVQDATNTDTFVTYTKEFLKSSDTRPDGRKLRAEYRDANGTYHPAEIVINPFDKRFYRPEFLMDDGTGRVDINKIKAKDPKLLLVFGTRIPHEGAQSSFVGEIVGFLQNGASTAITPDHLVARTGWDFDIDTVYLYHYATSSEFETYDIYDTSEKAMNRRLNNYIKTFYPDQYNANISKLMYENYTLYKEIKAINKATNEAILKSTSYRNAMTNLEDKIDRMYKAIANHESGKKILTDAELEAKQKTLTEAIARHKELSVGTEGKKALKKVYEDFKYTKEVSDAVKVRVKLITDLEAKIKANVEESTEYNKFRETVRVEFNKLDKIQQATKEERNNNILDSFVALHSDKTNNLDRDKPNEMDHIGSASDHVNRILGFNTANAHPTNLADKLYFRNLNMNVATIKESSVAYDNILAVLNVLKAVNFKHKVPAVMRVSEIFGYDPLDEITTLNDKLDNIFGSGNWTKEDDLIRIKNIGFIANNFNGEGLDIQGQRITEQRSELTTNILDAVKRLMVNLNQDSFGIFAYLASTPLSYYTNIHMYDKDGKPIKDENGNHKSEINRFIYPSLFISQPIVQELTKLTVSNNRFGDTKSSYYNVSIVRENYLSKILDVLIKNTEFVKYLEFNAKSFTFSSEEAREILSKSPKANIELIEERIRGDFEDTRKAIDTYKAKGNASGVSYKILNRFLKDNDFETIESRPYTLGVLENNIKVGKQIDETLAFNLEHVEFYINQLSTLEYYKEVERAASDVVNIMGVFNTDKLGASPNSGVSNKLLNNIVKIGSNFGEFETYLKDSLTMGFEDESYNSIIKSIRDTLHSKVSIVDKMDYIKDVYHQYDFKNSISPIRTKSGKSVIHAVYGDLFINSKPDYRKSEYPYLAAQAIWTNIFSTKLYNNVLLSESPRIKRMLNSTLAELNSVNEDKVRYKLLMYLINNSVKNIDFFNVDYSKILTVAKPKVEQLVDSTTNKVISTKVVNEIEKMISINEFKSSLEPTKTFSELTLTNQIMLLSEIGLNTKFLRWISPNLNQENINKRGFVEITISDTDANINEARSDFKRLYNSNNVYDRIVAENLIRYGFVTNGLQFGSSVSKYIDTDIFFDEKETGNRKNNLHTMADIMNDVSNIPSFITPELLDNIHKSNWDNEIINPTMDKTYYFSKGKPKVNTNRPTWSGRVGNLEKVKYEGNDERINHLILEFADFVDNSKYANNEYLTKEFNTGTTTFKVLYKRYRDELGQFYIYYPINKTLPFEYGTSVIPSNNAFPITTQMGDIASEREYFDMINNLSVTNKKTKEIDNSENESSYSKQIKKLHDESDAVVFIGKRTSDRGKVTLNTLPFGKVFSVTENELIKKGFNLKSKIASDLNTVTILGDDVLESEDVDINKALDKFIKKNNIKSVKTVLLKNTEINVATILTSSSDLSSIVDTKNIGQFSKAFSEIEYAPSSPESAVITMMSEIKNAEINILTIANRLKKHLQNYNVESISTLEEVVNESKNIIDNLDIAFPSMSAVSDLVKTNRVLYRFIVYGIEQILDEVSTVDITKFTQSDNYKDMIKYSNRIEEMFNYILVAEHALSLPTYTSEQIDKLNDDDKAIVSSYNNAVLKMQEDLNYINTLKTTVNDLIKDYHAIQVISRSDNPNYVESIHSYAVKYLLSEGYSLDEIPTQQITDADIKAVVKRMLNNNEDIGWFASKLDSSRDTYVTLPDILGKLYAETLYRARIDASRQLKQFRELLSTVYDKVDPNYNSDREKWFTDKFVDEYGELITEYDYALYKDKVKALYELKRIYTEHRHEARRTRNRAGIQEYNRLLANNREQLNKLHTKTEIKFSDASYNMYYEAWANIPEVHRRTYEFNNQIKFVPTDSGLRIFRYIPSDEFKSTAFAKLTDQEREFLMTLRSTITTLVKNVFPTYEMSNGFIPYSFNSNLRGDIKRMFGVAKKGKESFFVNLQGEVQYYLDAHMLHKPQTPVAIQIPKALPNESATNHEKRVLAEINKDRDETDKFKTLADVVKFNQEAQKAAKLKAKEVRNFDIANLMHDFINQLADVKTVRDFESSYRLALVTLGSDEFKATAKTAGGKDVFDNLKRYLSGKNETVKKSGKNTEAYDNLVRLSKPLYSISRTNNNVDMILNMVVRYTSLGTMAFNVRSGVKNIIIGYTNIVNEAVSREFINPSELTAATNDYRKALKHILSAVGKEESDDFTTALIKHFGGIFEDQSENVSDTSTNIIGKALRRWDTLAYMSLNSGEHFMQFTMLLGMLKSHRLVGDMYMSLYDYINDRRLSVLESKLSPELFKELNTYYLEEKEKETNATDYVDHIENWLNKNYTKISKETKTEIANAMKESRTKAEAEFKTFETLESQFELKDSSIVVKEGSKLNERTISKFADRVRKVNHSLHGIYNKIDRNQLQDSLFGELFMQFRKWMRPAFIRWFGAKYGKTQFSEGTGTYRSGAYLDFWKFISMPISRETKGDNPLITAIGNIAKGYIEFLQNYSYYYNNLPTHKRANINRALFSISSMAISTMLLYATYALVGGDDDKKKLDNFWVASTIYQLSAIQTELFETTPFGWATFYLRSKRNIMASERSITDLAAFFYYTMLYPFQTDKQRNYQTGMYKGDSKAEIRLEKAIPLWRQIHNFEYQSATINYYQMYNPILNLVGN